MVVVLHNISTWKEEHVKIIYHCFRNYFRMIKINPKLKDLNIFNHNYLYSAYAGDKIFFLNAQRSIRELLKTFKLFSKFSGLKPNTLICKDGGICSLKGIKMTVCGIKCIDLTTETIKILGVAFSYNQKLQIQKKFRKEHH